MSCRGTAPASDWAYVSLSTVDVDWGQRLSCTFVDDGSATVPSRELQGLWGSFRDLGYMATTLSRGTTWSGEDVCTCE